MFDVEEFDCNPSTVGQGATPVTLTFTGTADNNATPVSVVYSLAKDRELFWSPPAQGTIDASGKEMTVNTVFNVLPGPFSHSVQLNVGNVIENFQITLTATDQGGVSKIRRKRIFLQ